jgi:hypothetical protein
VQKYLIKYFKKNQWHNTNWTSNVDSIEKAKDVLQRIKISIQSEKTNPNKIEGVRLLEIIDGD